MLATVWSLQKADENCMCELFTSTVLSSWLHVLYRGFEILMVGCYVSVSADCVRVHISRLTYAGKVFIVHCYDNIPFAVGYSSVLLLFFLLTWWCIN